MRKQILIIFTILLFSCSPKKNSENSLISYKDSINLISSTKIDSLIINDDGFAMDPFSEKINFNYFIKRINTKYKCIDIFDRSFSDDAIDTIKLLKWGNSYVKAIPEKNEKEFFLIELAIYDSNFVLDRDIKIGQTAESVFKKFNKVFDKNKNYKFLQVETKEAAYNVIYFYFTNNILTSFEYYPYQG